MGTQNAACTPHWATLCVTPPRSRARPARLLPARRGTPESGCRAAGPRPLGPGDTWGSPLYLCTKNKRVLGHQMRYLYITYTLIIHGKSQWISTWLWKNIDEFVDRCLQRSKTKKRTLRPHSRGHDGTFFHHIAENVHKFLIREVVHCDDIHIPTRLRNRATFVVRKRGKKPHKPLSVKENSTQRLLPDCAALCYIKQSRMYSQNTLPKLTLLKPTLGINWGIHLKYTVVFDISKLQFSIFLFRF